MAKRVFQIVAVAGAFALVGMLSFGVIAQSDEVAEKGGGFLRHLHSMGHGLHGGHGGGHHDQMAEVIEKLNLRPDQQQHLENIHEIIGSMGAKSPHPMAELHEQLVTQFREGEIDADEVKEVVDRHVEEIRTMAYGITDELVVLVNGLDATQRETLLQHLQSGKAARHGHGH